MKIFALFANHKRQVARWIIGISVATFGIALLEQVLGINLYVYLSGIVIILLLLVLLRVSEEVLSLKAHTTHLYDQVEALFALNASLPKDAWYDLPKMRGYAASPDFLRELWTQVMEKKPKVIVEASCGVSSIYLSRLSKDIPGFEAHYALEHEAIHADRCREKISPLSDTQILHAPLKQYSLNGEDWQWYDMAELPDSLEIDMLIIDGPPYHIQNLSRYPAVPLLYDRLKPGATVILDDGGRKDEQEMVRRWKEQFGFKVEYQFTEKGLFILEKQPQFEHHS